MEPQVMQCMEVWGGNQTVDTGMAMSGLDAWVFSKPYGHTDTGGDVYYVSSCATGRITRLLVADVAGHGAAVHGIATDLRGLMRRYVNYLDQTRFVGEMNAQFAALSHNGCFATALVTTFFAPNNLLSVCNAGHPPPMLYTAADRDWRIASAVEPGAPPIQRSSSAPVNLPLGILDLADYEQFDLRLEVGDLVLFYTDSLIESKDAGGELLGVEGLLRVLRALPPGDPATLIATLLAAIAAEAPGNLTADDVTVLAFRPNGRAARATMRDRCLTPIRVLRGALGAIRHGAAAPLPDLNLANLAGAYFSRFNRSWKGTGRNVK